MAGASINPPTQAPDSVICPQCESTMPANAAFCPGCGRSMKPLPSAERAAAVIAYLTLFPAVVLLLLPAFRARRFVRFHAWQSILLWAIFFVLTVVGLFLSNIVATMFFLLAGVLGSLAMFFLWAVLSLKAWQSERFELPLLGFLAGRLERASSSSVGPRIR